VDRIREGLEWVRTTAWRPVVVARRVYERDRDVGGGLLAGALAFRLFVWLAAFVVLVVALLSFTGNTTATLRNGGLTGIAAHEVSDAVADTRRSRWLLLLAALYALFSTSRGMVRSLWTSSELSAGLPVDKPPQLRGVLAYNAIMFALFATVGGASRLRDLTPGPGLVITFATIVVFVALTWLGLHWLPGPDVPPRDLLPGAIVLGVGLDIMHLVGTLYLPGRLDRASDTYGTLGTAIVLLLWLYLFGRLMIAGGVLNATLRELREESEESDPAPSP
jgi:uncharacterized BrkB/YihY/UPF0761 family membrane protein